MSKLADYPFENRPLSAEEGGGVSLNSLVLTFIAQGLGRNKGCA